MFNRHFNFPSLWKWLLVGGAVGVTVGMPAVVFQFLLQTTSMFLLESLAGVSAGHPAGEHPLLKLPRREQVLPWLILLLPAAGGLIAGYLVNRFAPEAKGHGTDAAIDAYHRKQGQIRQRVPIVKLFASVVTLSAGGSGGREGPIAQIGAGVGSFIAQRFGLGAKTQRMLVAVGMAAGIGAIFRAPLASALFAAEVLYSGMELESEVILPGIIASILSYSIYCSWFGFGPIFGVVPEWGFSSPVELIGYLALALVVGVGALLYVNTFYGLTRFFDKLPVSPYLKPAVGGLLTGLIGLGLWTLTQNQESLAVLSTGYGILQKILTGDGLALGIGFLLLVALGKILTTSLTIGSGGSAGVFGPSMVIGGTLGAAVGLAMHALSPVLAPHPAAFMIVGMAGFFAAAANAPLSTLIMVSELTGNYELLIPSMWVCAVAFLVGRPWTLYKSQVSSRLASPAHFGEYAPEILSSSLVSEVFKASRKFMAIPEALPISQVFDQATRSSQRIFPVVSPTGKLLGFFRLNDLTTALHLPPEEASQTLAKDIIVPDRATVRLNDPVQKALNVMANLNVDELLVTTDDDPRTVCGIVTGADIMLHYSRQYSRIKHGGIPGTEETDASLGVR
ncbi:MAG: chloride channel protein [Myxococcales bacterium]|nr:MAG: chloride channel protein [Myxococcales bacterium]